MSIWDSMVQNASNTKLVKTAQNALQNWGYQDQQGNLGHTGSWGLKDYGITELFKPTNVSANEYTPPAPMSNETAPMNTNTAPSGVDLSNPVKKTEYAQSNGYDNYDQMMAAMQNTAKPDMNAINDVYNPVMSFLNQEESRISGQMPSVLQSAQEAFDVSKGTLGSNKAASEGMLGEQGISAEQARINEENEQRRLYNELNMGGNQRFGGASSASEAYRALLGQEQQRVGATTAQQYQTAKREIETAKYNLQQDYTNKMASLEQQLRETQTNIRLEFEDRLAQIRSMKAESESAKANAKLGALQEYKNNMYNLQMANMQYKQQLQLQTQAYASELDNASKQWEEYVGGGQQGVNTFNQQTAGQPTSGLSSNTSFGAQGAGSTGNFTPMGQITSGKKDEDNIFTSMFGGGGAG